MDLATIIGVLSGIGFVLFGILLGSSIGTFINIPSLLITVGGAVAATLMSFPLPEILKISKITIKVIKTGEHNAIETIQTLLSYAERSRRLGLLSLESEIDEVKDDFLRTGMRLVIDGANPDEIRDILETEIEFMSSRHKRAQDLFLTLAKFAPAFGMIGTLIGLIAMLKTMNDPSTIGPSMAVSLITTFYGSLMANLFCMPIAGKLKTRTADEILVKRAIIEGVIMIQAQVNPRFINQKLVTFLPPAMREAISEKKGKKVLEYEEAKA